MTMGPAGTESREPIYLPPSPHQEHMALLMTMLVYLKEMNETLIDIADNTREPGTSPRKKKRKEK